MTALRILVVDDNGALAENLKEILDDEGYVVRLADSCAHAREAIAAQPFDLGLVDLVLPDGEGTSLAPLFKEANPDAEVVLLTGHASVESAAEAVRAGASAYLVKPCATAELLATVERSGRHVRRNEETRELARRAQVAEKLAAVGTLTAGLSHEIRNPLNAAALQLQLLERRVGKLEGELQPPLLEPLQLVRDEIRRLDHILEDFLQFARPRELVANEVDTSTLLARVCDLLSTDADERSASLERDFDGAPPVVGDESQLQQVLVNLVLNALDATVRGGRVRVSFEAGAEVRLLVDDSGPGVPATMREKIFEPFFTTKPAGSGLGLAIVRAIVTQHGGSLVVTDSPLGGARFVVTLPRAS